MTHPDTLTIHRAVDPEWGPQQAYAEGRSAYENSMLPNATSAVRFNELSSSEQAFWVAHAAFRAALQPQVAVTTSGPPERDNYKPAEQQGVFRKFNVQRTDGSDQPGGKHHGCEYFVLDVAHDQHAKPALEAYAVACATTHPQLSADMRERYGLQPQAAAEPVTDAPDLPEPVGVVLGFEDASGMAMVDHASEGGPTLEEKQCVYSGDQMEQRWFQGFLAGKSRSATPNSTGSHPTAEPVTQISEAQWFADGGHLDRKLRIESYAHGGKSLYFATANDCDAYFTTPLATQGENPFINQRVRTMLPKPLPMRHPVLCNM